jgi:uncharacterized protein YjbI with pentapeptide repeats
MAEAEERRRLAQRIARGRHWLSAPRPPLTWSALVTKLATLKLPSTYFGRLAALGIIILLVVPLWHWYAQPHHGEKGEITYTHANLVNPILGGLGALFLIYTAIRQARTATEVARTGNRQAEIAGLRHVTETFGKAVEQLASEKMEARVGGIYTLERLAREAIASSQSAEPIAEEGGEPDPKEAGEPDLYWGVMETLAAFVRERTRPEAERLAKPREQRIAEVAYLLWENAGSPEGPSDYFWSEAAKQEAQKERPATDIAAVLEVIRRRPKAGITREKQRSWHFDLHGTDLRGADLNEAHLEGAQLRQAHLEGAQLRQAHLEGAQLDRAHLEDADLYNAHLEGVYLNYAHLERAALDSAHLEDAHLNHAHLERAILNHAHLERAGLSDAHLEDARLNVAHLEDAHVNWAHLEGVYLNYAHLERASLIDAHLEGAHLDKAHLEGAFLPGAHLEGASLIEAHLEGAHLSGHLEGARLDGAHLEAAYLGGAHLEGAYLGGAHLEGAVLTQANLHGAVSLDQQQLDQACGEDVILDPPLTIKPCPSAALVAGTEEVGTDADQQASP